MLSNFQLGDQALLQSFLVGQPELRAMMQGPQMQQLRQRVIASYHLGPLDKSETQAYIEHRLKHVGWKDDPRFEPACFDLIHALTGGIPRRINTLCNRLLLATFLAERHVIDTGDVQTIAREIGEEMGAESTLAQMAVIDGGGTDGEGLAPDTHRSIGLAPAFQPDRGADRSAGANGRRRRRPAASPAASGQGVDAKPGMHPRKR